MATNSEAGSILAICAAPGSADQKTALVNLILKQRPDMLEARVQAAASRILAEHGQFRTIPKILKEFAA